MDITMISESLFANQYFRQAIHKVYVRYGQSVKSLAERCENEAGGRCYYLTSWALLGLNSQDRLVRGVISLPERDGWKARRDYSHGWVRFIYRDEEYIYDPLYPHVFPAAAWENVHEPQEITFDRPQSEILEIVLTEEHAYKVTDNGLWQIKSHSFLPQEWEKRDSGYLADTLAQAQINYSYGYCNFALVVSNH